MPRYLEDDAAFIAPMEQLYAWVARDGEGREAIVSLRFEDAWYPLVGVIREEVEAHRADAQDIAMACGYVVRLVQFRAIVVLEVIEPPPPAWWGLP